MVQTREDLTGKTFNMLTVIEQTDDYVNPSGVRYARWKCCCNCGKIIVTSGNSLKNGRRKSCGSHYKKVGNKYDLQSQDYAIGYTSKGDEFWFDKEDYPIVSQYTWVYNAQGYVVTHKNRNEMIFLHRLVTGATETSQEVDHIVHPNGKSHKIDNRKSNLSIGNHQQNMRNQSLRKNNTSGNTGVHFNKKRNKWESYIMVDGEKIWLGCYENKEDAIKARLDGEKQYFQK